MLFVFREENRSLHDTVQEHRRQYHHAKTSYFRRSRYTVYHTLRHGLELFGEQGGEKLHHVFNKIHVRSNCVPGNQGDKLTAALKTHLAHVAPEFFVH